MDDRALTGVRADDRHRNAMSIDVVGTILRIVLDDGDQRRDGAGGELACEPRAERVHVE